jgi:surface antigen
MTVTRRSNITAFFSVPYEGHTLAGRPRRHAVPVIAASAAAILVAGCAHEPTAIERKMAAPSAESGNGRQAAPAIAAASALNDADQPTMIEHFNHAMESAPTGQPVTWTNPSGVTVQLSATRTFQQADGTYCREFTQTITSGSQPNVARGTACRQSDATWQIIS